VCTKWSNPVIHRNSPAIEAGPSTATIRYLDWNSGLVVAPEEDQQQDTMCGLQDIGGHLMKIPIIGFQVLLCMHLEVCILLVVLARIEVCCQQYMIVSNFREHLLVLEIYHFQFCSLLFSYCKGLVCCLLPQY